MMISKSQLQEHTIPQPPGSPSHMRLEEFVNSHMLAVLPSPEMIAYYHRLIASYVVGADPLMIVRHVRGTERGVDVSTNDGSRLRPSDNAPAWFFHALLFNGVRVEPSAFAELIGELPAHMFQMPSGFPNINRPDLRRPPGEQGWHVAHILDAKDGNVDWRNWTPQNCRQRFVRNIHPLNLFYVPKPGWRKNGGDPDVIAYAASIHAKRNPNEWEDFLELAGGQDLEANGRTGDKVLEFPDSKPANESARRKTKPANESAKQKTDPKKKRASRPDRGTWSYVMGAASPPPIGELLARCPRADARTTDLVRSLDLEGFLVLSDTLFNKCRISAIEKIAPGGEEQRGQVAWELLEAGMAKRHTRPSGWTGAARLLADGAEQALGVLKELEIEWLAAAALRVVTGPYEEANRLRIR